MGLFKRKKKEVREETTSATSFYPSWMESTSTPMLLSTVYRCVDLISDSIAVLPLETYRVDSEGFKTPMRDSGDIRDFPETFEPKRGHDPLRVQGDGGGQSAPNAYAIH